MPPVVKCWYYVSDIYVSGLKSYCRENHKGVEPYPKTKIITTSCKKSLNLSDDRSDVRNIYILGSLNLDINA